MDRSIVHVFQATAAKKADGDALRFKSNGRWQAISWREYVRRVRAVAKALIKLGLEPGSAVAIAGFNRWEWLVSDLGVMAAGGVPAPIYQTCTPDQAGYIAGHCEAQFAIVEDMTQVEKFRAQKDRLPRLERIIVMQRTDAGADAGVDGDGAEDLLSFDAFLKAGDDVADQQLDARLDALSPETLATIIYTSGTTGHPKGVMLSHKNLIFTAGVAVNTAMGSAEEHLISYLPLSHIAEQMISIHAAVTRGATVSFAEGMAKLGDNLREIRPTVFLGVPRVWEKIQSKMMEAGAKNSGLKKQIAAWARRVGMEGGRRLQRGEPLPWTYELAERLVFSKVKEKLGLDRCAYPVTSAAPIGKDTLEFFLSLGIPIYEVYGMSESTGPATGSKPGCWEVGSAGPPLPGTEVKVADDGEICMRGDHVFMGYYKNPEATREALDEERWLHSGDVGQIDDRGFIKITDRKKDLIITAGGKNVAPQNIEALLKSIRGVAQVAVIGDRRRFLTALIALDPEDAQQAAKAHSGTGKTLAQLAEDKDFQSYLEKSVEDVNRKLARFETIKKFKVLANEFTVDTGELTPTLKLKRRVVMDKYKDDIEAMYV